MIYVKIDNKLYPANVHGKNADVNWDNRESKTIELEMTCAEAASLFVNDLVWSIVMDVEQKDGTIVQEEYDNSDYSVAGSITDNRNGIISVKMGKPTDREMLEELMGVLNND